MRQLATVAACTLALCLPLIAQAQTAAHSSRQNAEEIAAAFGSPLPQDQDDRNPNWDADRDRDWHRDHDRDHDRHWDADRDRAFHERGYRGVLAPEWQGKFDSYYQRWLNYRAKNNEDEMRSMERRMQDIMRNYNIPPDVPYGDIASGGR